MPGRGRVASGGQGAGEGESHIPRPADQVIDAVVDGLVVDETVQRGRVAELRVSIYLAGRASEADPPQQVLNQQVSRRHRTSPPCHILATVLDLIRARMVKDPRLQNSYEAEQLVHLRTLPQELAQQDPRGEPRQPCTVTAGTPGGDVPPEIAVRPNDRTALALA